jgi:hypothetical protein
MKTRNVALVPPPASSEDIRWETMYAAVNATMRPVLTKLGCNRRDADDIVHNTTKTLFDTLTNLER